MAACSEKREVSPVQSRADGDGDQTQIICHEGGDACVEIGVLDGLTQEEQQQFLLYVERSDKVCMKYASRYAALGESKNQAPIEVYAAQIRGTNEVHKDLLDEWRAIAIPHKAGEVRGVQSLVQASIRLFEIAANSAEAGEPESANAYLLEAGRSAMNGISKARSLGFKYCPLSR
ncbi:hypothetical protein AB0H51_05160 [Streptomyces griseoluteus]|uniref:hypothetical protein n=1 Tax=Streptomyces griseoluteus TaxID=29306 RepID=UPI0033FC45A1